MTRDRDCSWEVPGAARVSTVEGLVGTRDDRLISGALVARYDELIANAKLRTGSAFSHVVPPLDPLDNLRF